MKYLAVALAICLLNAGRIIAAAPNLDQSDAPELTLHFNGYDLVVKDGDYEAVELRDPSELIRLPDERGQDVKRESDGLKLEGDRNTAHLRSPGPGHAPRFLRRPAEDKEGNGNDLLDDLSSLGGDFFGASEEDADSGGGWGWLAEMTESERRLQERPVDEYEMDFMNRDRDSLFDGSELESRGRSARLAGQPAWTAGEWSRTQPGLDIEEREEAGFDEGVQPSDFDLSFEDPSISKSDDSDSGRFDPGGNDTRFERPLIPDSRIRRRAGDSENKEGYSFSGFR